MRAALAILATLTLPGCTLYVWHPKVTWWELERRSYERIEAVSRGENGAVYVRVARNRDAPETWRFTWPPGELADGTSKAVDLELVAAGEFPAESTGPVRVMTAEEIEAIHWGRQESIPPSDAPALLVGLETDSNEAELYVMDSGVPKSQRKAALPDSPVAWESPNAIGHIAVTPLTVTIDVALLPLYLLGGVIILIHYALTGRIR